VRWKYFEIHFVISVRQLGSHWTDFHENLRVKIFGKYVAKIQV